MAARQGSISQAQNRGAFSQSGQGRSAEVNISEPERYAMLIGGGAMTVYGLARGSWGGLALALLGGGMIYRGYTGHCDVYEALNINTAGARKGRMASVAHNQGIKVEQTVTINKSPEELYRFWRNFENLPRFMNHLESVKVQGDKRSHWVAKAPLGSSVEWDAEIHNEIPNQLIAWRSLEGADIPNAGSVRFEPAPGGKGTEVKVALEYDPPAGMLGSYVAKLFGEEPEQQVEEDLARFKQVMESGGASTTGGQPSGRPATSQK